MKKFLFLYLGQQEMDPEIMAGWGAWFEKNHDAFLDMGNPCGEGREITRDGAGSITGVPVSGYSLVSAESLEAAEKLLEGLPFGHGVQIYEAVPM